MAEASKEDRERAGGWARALATMDGSEAKRKTVSTALRIFTAMHATPHLFAKPVSLPDSFPAELSLYGLDQLEKAARLLARMGAVELVVHRQGLKPTKLSLVYVPAGPIS